MAETYTNATQPNEVYRYHPSTDTLEKTTVTQVTTGGETGLRYLMVFRHSTSIIKRLQEYGSHSSTIIHTVNLRAYTQHSALL